MVNTTSMRAGSRPVFVQAAEEPYPVNSLPYVIWADANWGMHVRGHRRTGVRGRRAFRETRMKYQPGLPSLFHAKRYRRRLS